MDASVYWLVFLLMAAIILPIALWFILTGRAAQRRAIASLTWPTVTGRVLESDVSTWYRTKTGHHYQPRIRYEYAVGGKTHVSDVIRFGLGESASEAEAKSIIAPYQAGSSVEVRYDPHAPATATLETSVAAARARIIGGWISLTLPFIMVGVLYLIVRFAL
jgi:hypothetical protein